MSSLLIINLHKCDIYLENIVRIERYNTLWLIKVVKILIEKIKSIIWLTHRVLNKIFRVLSLSFTLFL